MANRAAPPPPPPNGSMLTMLLVMILMTFLIINPNIRNALGNMADPILAPVLPETEFFILTVLILGTFSMTLTPFFEISLQIQSSRLTLDTANHKFGR